MKCPHCDSVLSMTDGRVAGTHSTLQKGLKHPRVVFIAKFWFCPSCGEEVLRKAGARQQGILWEKKQVKALESLEEVV